MAWTLILVFSVLLVGAYFSAPKEYTAHASREKKLPHPHPMGVRTSMFRRQSLRNGNMVPVRVGMVIVRASGASFEGRGIKDGSAVIAERVTKARSLSVAQELKHGDIIIIDGPGNFQSGLRFRAFDRLEDNEMHFLADTKGVPGPRPVGQLWAKVLLKEVT